MKICWPSAKNGEAILTFWYAETMSETKTVDISGIKFSSTTFPTPEDMELWESLTNDQRKAVEIRDEEEGYKSGVAEPRSMGQLIAEAKAEKKKE